MTATTAPAPGRLEVVRSFVNTRDIEQGTDRLRDGAGLADWIRERGLIAADEACAPTEEQRLRAVGVREAFRALLLANNDGRTADAGAVATLNDAAERARLHMRISADGRARLETRARGLDGALGRLLLIAYEAMERGDWSRLKACRNDTCQWGFYDHSKNRSKTWCLMEVCGSQVKSRAYRARRRAETAHDDAG